MGSDRSLPGTPRCPMQLANDGPIQRSHERLCSESKEILSNLDATLAKEKGRFMLNMNTLNSDSSQRNTRV